MIVLLGLLLAAQFGPAQAQESVGDLTSILDSFGVQDDSTLVVVDPILLGAIASMEAGDNEAAAAELEDIVFGAPDHLQALRLQASCYIRLRDIEGAIATCLQIAGLDSLDTTAEIALGYLYEKAGDPDNAELYYSLALEKEPEAYHAIFGLGWIQMERRDLDAAHDAATRITEIAPDYAPNYVLLGRVLTVKGFYKEAARAFRRGFGLDLSLRNRYGILLQELGQRHQLSR